MTHTWDPEEGGRRRDEAVALVEANAPVAWSTAAFDIGKSFRERFTTDDIWWELDLQGVPAPREPRAMGAVLNRLRLGGYIVETGEYRVSIRAECHRSPKRVWQPIHHD